MSLNVLIFLVTNVMTAAAGTQPLAGCSPDARAVLARADAQMRAAEYDGAAESLRQAYNTPARCPDLVTAAWAWNGWLSALNAANQGGTTEALKPVQEALAALEPSGRSVATPAEYAAALVHAAAAAAQHERDEMRVWLDHARDVASRLALTGVVATWPMPIDLAEGELWLEVDDFEAARTSFMRALASEETAAGLRGLARARLRLGDTSGACAAYRKASPLVAATFPKGVVVSEAGVALPWCAP